MGGPTRFCIRARSFLSTPASPEAEHGGEQKSGENEDIDRFYQYFHLSSPPYMNAKQYRTITASAVTPQRT